MNIRTLTSEIMGGIGAVLLFGIYLLLMLLTAGGYCVKMLVDAVLTEIVTGFWRLGNKLGMGIGGKAESRNSES